MEELRRKYNLQSLTKFNYYLKKNKLISQEFPEIIYFLQEIDECFKTFRRHAIMQSQKNCFYLQTLPWESLVLPL